MFSTSVEMILTLSPFSGRKTGVLYECGDDPEPDKSDDDF